MEGKLEVDWAKPVRFTKVQGDDHLSYKPNVMGSFSDDHGQPRYVVVARNWLDAKQRYSFLVYDKWGQLVGNNTDASATGIFDATIVNGKADIDHLDVKGDGKVRIYYLDGKPVKAELL